MRIVHLSDLHFGRHDPLVVAGLAEDLAAQRPDLVVISGDFTQIGSASEFEAAAIFLKTLPAPVFAVPGNHDVPARNLLLRFTDPYQRYRKHIARDLEPFLQVGDVAIAGIKTSRRLRMELNWAHGSISRDQLAQVERRFSACNAGVRIVVAHHPLLQPELASSLRTVKRADLALSTFARLGVRLVLSGHFHMSYVRHHKQGEPEIVQQIPSGPQRAAQEPIIVAQASTTISTRLRGEPNAYNVIDIEDGQITIRVREWWDRGWRTREKLAA